MTARSLLEPARLAGRSALRTQSDERLVDLVRAGCESAFEAIVHRYRRQLVRYCGRMLPDGRAEDAVQQTFVNAYDAMRRSGARLELRPWLYRIAHNASLNALRDRALRHEPLSEHHDGVERPEQALERAQGLRDVLDAVKALPERQRAAILLRELEGRSYEEIAGGHGAEGPGTGDGHSGPGRGGSGEGGSGSRGRAGPRGSSGPDGGPRSGGGPGDSGPASSSGSGSSGPSLSSGPSSPGDGSSGPASDGSSGPGSSGSGRSGEGDAPTASWA